MSEKPKELREVRKIGGEEIEVILRKTETDMEEVRRVFPPLEPGVTVENGIYCERDVAVRLRDGTTIYTDIYRPEGATSVPAIVAWSPYGKRAGYEPDLGLVNLSFSFGLPRVSPTPMAMFEGPDPGYWCHYGYAVINTDPRGVGNSEGTVIGFGTQEGQDCYDLIEWVAARDWSNGKVGMSGNSWVAIIQWFAAAERPPHLTCIAPWEGLSDAYREFVCRGGIPETDLTNLVMNACGPGRTEDVAGMALKYSLMNAYWEDKIAKVENIEIPAYIVAGYTNPFHPRGTFGAFERIPSPNKWLRVHNNMEWPDLRTPENHEDLRLFYDRYLKGIHNGWELTPRVRMTVCDPGGVDQINRPETDWPLPQTQYQRLFLNADTGTLSPSPVTKESSVRYDAQEGEATFTIRFDKDTELTGYAKLRLWVEADEADDMDLFVRGQKLDEQGNPFYVPVAAYPDGEFWGWLRVSHRELDEARSTPYQPYHTHRREQLLKPKEIVPVDIEIWPIGTIWHAGQQLRVTVSGHFTPPWKAFKHLPPEANPCRFVVRNKGNHIIHTGGKYDSHLLVPVIPPEVTTRTHVYPRHYVPVIPG